MYCNKVYKRDLVDYDQRFSLNKPVLPLRELYAKCSFIFIVSLKKIKIKIQIKKIKEHFAYNSLNGNTGSFRLNLWS